MAVRLGTRTPSKRTRLAEKRGAAMLDLSTVHSMQEGMRLLGQHMAQRRKDGFLTKRKQGRARRTVGRKR